MLHVVLFTDELHGFYGVPLYLAKEMQRKDKVVESDEVIILNLQKSRA